MAKGPKARALKSKASGSRTRRTAASRPLSDAQLASAAARRTSRQSSVPPPPPASTSEEAVSAGSKRARPDEDDAEDQPRVRAAPGAPGDDPNPGSSAIELDDGKDDADIDPLPVDGEDDVLHGRDSFLRQKGKMIGRLAKASESLLNALKAGFSSDIAAENIHRILFDKIVKVAPSLVVFIEAVEDESGLDIEFLEAVAEALDRGRKDARGDDTNGLKHAVGEWSEIEWGSTPFPKQARHLAGFEHPICGRYLCPVTLNWDTDGERLRTGETVVFADDFPAFLWPKGKYNPADMSQGFLEGELLILAYKHIHLGPSAALGLNRATRPGNSRIHGITFVTIEGIAYVAFLLRFVLSDQATFSLGGAEPQGKTWCNYEFYNAIIDVAAEMSKEKIDELLLWWNKRIYPETTRTAAGARSSAGSSSAASRMLAQMQAATTSSA